MALRCAAQPWSPNRIIIIKKHSPLKKTRVVMLARPESSVTILRINNTPFLQIKNKVFEDPSEGIVCYRDDDTGEITCEGYDEGPRFHHHHLTRLTCNPGDAKTIEVLQRSWLLQLVDREDVAAANISIPLADSATYYAN